MSAELSVVPSSSQEVDLTAIERVIVSGDLSKLSPDERWDYYRGVCRSVGLNPFTQPFLYITLSGKLTLYATKGATDQLRRRYHVSISKPDVTLEDGLCMVSVMATDPTGRTDAELGIVPIEGLTGDTKANAILKAITKAKRRVTLSMCGLGMLDESEVETIRGAEYSTLEQMHGEAQPTEAEEERARAMVGDEAEPSQREKDEATFKDLAKQCVLQGHPKKERIAAVDPSTLTDGVLSKSIKDLEAWLAADPEAF
jgi:hypothetical protein